MKSTNHFPNGKASALARLSLIIFASAFLASCVTPKPPQSEKIALQATPKKSECAKQIINVGKKPRPTKVEEWDPCVNYQPGAVESPRGKVGKSEDVLIIAALSGGGKRSAAFAYGVFDALNNVSINLADEQRKYSVRPLLEEIDLISAVSGGAMTASYYALHRRNTFLPKDVACGYESFLYEDTGAKIWDLYLFPWNWGWMLSSSYGSNDVMAKFFSERLFGMPAEQEYQPLQNTAGELVDLTSYCAKPSDERPNGAVYADLYDQGPPFLLLSSTDLTRGLTFPYSQDGFDLVCADVSEFPLAWALAGTNAFPVVLSTINLKNNHAASKQGKPCKPRRNHELVKVFDENIGCVPLESILDQKSEPTVGADNQFFRSDTLLRTAMTCYARPGDATYVHLADGGMTDNFALKGITDWFHTHRGTSSFWYLVHTTKRAQLLIIDGQRDVDPKIARTPQGPDVLDAVGTMISNSVDQSNISSFAETRDLFEVLSRILAVRDFVVFDEWQKESLGPQYDASNLGQFTKFLDDIEKCSEPHQGCDRVFKKFEVKFSEYVTDIRKTYGTTSDKENRELVRWNKFHPISRVIDIIQVAELYGATGIRPDWNSDRVRAILGYALYGDGTTSKDNDKLRAGIDDILKADKMLRGKLERVKEFRVRKVSVTVKNKQLNYRYPAYWVDISKISVVDDCNTNRRNLLMSSDTGMGLDEEIIAGAIEAGKDIGRRHAEPILTFLNTGERGLLPNCQTWVGSKATKAGADTADPESKPD